MRDFDVCRVRVREDEVEVEGSEESGALTVADDEQGDDRGDGGRSGRGRTVSAESLNTGLFLGSNAHRPLKTNNPK